MATFSAIVGDDLIARWESRGRKYWADLYAKSDPSGRYYSYRSDDGGGVLAAKSRSAAIAEMEKKIAYLTPDRHKNPLRRVL